MNSSRNRNGQEEKDKWTGRERKTKRKRKRKKNGRSLVDVPRCLLPHAPWPPKDPAIPPPPQRPRHSRTFLAADLPRQAARPRFRHRPLSLQNPWHSMTSRKARRAPGCIHNPHLLTRRTGSGLTSPSGGVRETHVLNTISETRVYCAHALPHRIKRLMYTENIFGMVLSQPAAASRFSPCLCLCDLT